MNYNQVFSHFGLKPISETTFCINYQSSHKYFSLFRSPDTGNVNCLYFNNQSLNTPGEVFMILNDSVLVARFENDLQKLPEIGTSLEIIPVNKLVNFLYSFIPLREVVWDKNAENIFSYECFENVFSNKNNTDLSILLSDENDNICDVIDFNNSFYRSKFKSSKAIWKSKYYSNMKEAVVCFNPYCMVNFYSNNTALQYFTILVSDNQNLILQSRVFELLMKYPFSCYNILYTENCNELYPILDLMVFYCKFYWGVDVFVRNNVDNFTLTFSFDIEKNVTQYLQFNSLSESHYLKLLSSSNNEAGQIMNMFPFQVTNNIIENRKICSLTFPNKVESYQALLHNLLVLMKKTNQFNLILCK